MGQAVGGGGTDGSGTPHEHIADGEGGGAKVWRADHLEVVGQQALVNQAHLVGGLVESHGAKMLLLAVKGHLHINQVVCGFQPYP